MVCSPEEESISSVFIMQICTALVSCSEVLFMDDHRGVSSSVIHLLKTRIWSC
jgi:hypothetical protein